MNVSMIMGRCFIFNSEDVLTLRKKYRIVGRLVGCSSHKADAHLGLPLLLLNEEMFLLQKLGVISKITEANCDKPSPEIVQIAQDFATHSYIGQREVFRQERLVQITTMSEKIIDGKAKRRKINCNDEDPISASKLRKDAVSEETSKIIDLPPKNAILQTFMGRLLLSTTYFIELLIAVILVEIPWNTSNNSVSVNWQFAYGPHEILRSRIFSDLWEKGFYLTDGANFGADFLAYPGDPLSFHARYIVIAVPKKITDKIEEHKLVVRCRLGISVKKTILLASPSSQSFPYNVCYQSLEWTKLQR